MMASSPLKSLGPDLVRWFTRVPAWFFELSPAVKRPILTLVIFLIVVVPAMMFDLAAHNAAVAAHWVAHTQEVATQIYRTLFDLRDAEAAMRTLIIVPPADLRSSQLTSSHDYQASVARLDPDLDTLQQLTIDNPRQQERIGRLRAAFDGRSRMLNLMLEKVNAGRRDQAGAMLVEVIPAYPFREVADEMLQEESGLLAERIAKSSAQQRIASTVIWSSVLAQLLLIASIYLISEKDVERRRAAEEISAEASAHAQTIVDTNPDPLVVLDARGRIRSANKAFTVFYGVEAGRIRGEFLQEIGHGAWNLPDLQQRLVDLIPQEREIWDYEISQFTGGERRIMLVNARPFPGAFGQKLILLAAKDVTARKRTEEQITRLNQELSLRVEQADAVNQELEAFSYSVSHDLRAPLRHITGFSDMLQRQLVNNDDPKTVRYLKYIQESAGQMGNLIDDLLVFSRMGRTEMVRDEVDMSEVVREVLKHYNLETEGRRIEFAVEELPSVRGDRAMLRLVWMNLIGNAIKYSRQREVARIEIGSKPSDLPERIYFIRDNGVGFNMKYAHKLFGVFQRLHQADEYEGTGIGLANVRRIVQRHGGKAWAQGYIDQGATFSFSIPLENHASLTPGSGLTLPAEPALA